uniref:Uncharacterized protein n=1 Tax=Anguilla anguilla TaxID=7936 RepID=A0A0E9WU81_ANGAN
MFLVSKFLFPLHIRRSSYFPTFSFCCIYEREQGDRRRRWRFFSLVYFSFGTIMLVGPEKLLSVFVKGAKKTFFCLLALCCTAFCPDAHGLSLFFLFSFFFLQNQTVHLNKAWNCFVTWILNCQTGIL